MALRSIWNGTIAFAGVFVPIKVHSATEDRSVHFHEVHQDDGARIEHKRICPKEDKEVPYKEIVRGYEVSSGKYVVLEKEEIDAAAGERSRLIDVEDFVCAADIDPVFFDKTYYLGAGDAGKDAYRLLHDALEKSDRVGIGRWVFHNREYLVAIRANGDVISLHTLRFAEEVADPKDLEISEPEKGPSQREVKMAGSLVEALAADWKPESYEDTYRASVLEMIEAKAKGKQIIKPEEEEPAEESDLFAALEASVKGLKS